MEHLRRLVQSAVGRVGDAGGHCGVAVLHVISARPEVIMAQRLALAAPYPDPPVNAPPSIAEAIDIRPGYFAIQARNNGAEYLTTSLYEMGLLWSRAFLERSVSVATAGAWQSCWGAAGRHHRAALCRRRRAQRHHHESRRWTVSLSLALNGFTPSTTATLLTLRGEDRWTTTHGISGRRWRFGRIRFRGPGPG